MPNKFYPIRGAQRHAQRFNRDDIPFVVVTMFTSNLVNDANRLKASLDNNLLNYVLYQIPTVHRSISTRGSDDIAFCKPNFIHHVMEQLQRPVLYIDADIVIRKFPSKIMEIAARGCDFAIYNWIADPANDAYMPVPMRCNGMEATNRYYRFSHSIDILDPSQLLCSGAVQFYNNSEGARNLLAGWLHAINQYAGVRDDELLDYAFNFRMGAGRVKATWIDKAHCRYPWWINVSPIIDHPAFPVSQDSWRSFAEAAGHHRFRVVSANRHPPRGPFPRDCLIDTQKNCLLRIVDGTVVTIGRFDTKLWLHDCLGVE